LPQASARAAQGFVDVDQFGFARSNNFAATADFIQVGAP